MKFSLRIARVFIIDCESSKIAYKSKAGLHLDLEKSSLHEDLGHYSQQTFAAWVGLREIIAEVGSRRSPECYVNAMDNHLRHLA